MELTAEQLEIIYNRSNDLIFMIGVESKGSYRVISANQTYFDRTGTEPQQLINQPLESVFPPENLSYLLEKYGEVERTGETSRYQTKLMLKGEVSYLDTTLVPVFDQDKCRYIVGVSREITEAMLERKALARERDRAETYLNIARAIIVASDRDGNVLMVNRYGYEVLGYPKDSLTGKPFSDYVVSERTQVLADNYSSAMRTGDADSESVVWIRAANGEKRLVSWTVSMMLDENGEPDGFLSSGEDITQRHRVEKAMIASQRVTAAGEVVSAVAHDFNNALQGILGNIELAMLKPGLDVDVKEFLNTAGDLARDAAERIVLLQKMSASEQTESAEEIHLNDLLDEVVEQTRHLWRDEAEKRGCQIQLKKEYENDGNYITGNTAELRSLFYNIIKNAIEAIDSDGVIVVSSFTTDNDQVIEVSDTGVGMDEATATRIFQPFYSTKGYEVGRGLGMSSAHTVARAHGGQLSVAETAPGAGTRIEVRLPLESKPGTEDESGTTVGRILWVDDDPAIRTLATRFIATLGFEADVAASGREAVQLVRDRTYSLVLTDIGMPDMNGYEVASEVAKLSGGTLPVVALTGWGDTLNEQQRKKSGISRVLAKPIRLQDLRQAIEELLAVQTTSIR